MKFAVPGNAGQELLVLDNVSASIEENELVSIIGPSGCGKSTLLRIVAGLAPSTSGETLVDGEVQQGVNPHCSMVFQQIGLIPWRTVAKNVQFALEVQRGSRTSTADAAKVREVLQLVGLAGFEKYYPYQISGGMQQRVGIARAIVAEPRIILMDEPFGALDAQTRNILQDELLRLRTRLKTTIFFVTHDLEEAVYLSDRILVLSRRPATIREVIKVNLPPNRTEYDCRAEPEFLTIRKHVWQLLKEENSASSNGR